VDPKGALGAHGEKSYFSKPNQTSTMSRDDQGYSTYKGRIREWISHAKRRMDSKSKYAFVASLNRSDAVVLDVGCGFDSVRKLKQHAPLVTFDGADIQSYYMTEEGIQAMRNYWIFSAEQFVEELSACGEQYDGIILSHVIEHVAHPHEFLDKTIGLLKEGGKLYLSTPTVKSTDFPSVKKGCLNFFDDPTHTAPFPIETWIASASTYGNVTWTPRHRGGVVIRLAAWCTWPYTMLTRRITPLTWYAFGFESIAVLERKQMTPETPSAQ
jgi:2-polyprenyl-3-methyl-5-hydroxy-6-metoxy-1,4-benzoquinol methylase